MVSRTFRLEESTVDQLEYIAESRECTKTEAIRFAIQTGYDALQEEYAWNGDSGDLQRQIDYLQNANLALLDQNAQLVDALSKAQAVQAVLAAPKRRFLPPWRWGRKNRE